jgi:hypothetical protein
MDKEFNIEFPNTFKDFDINLDLQFNMDFLNEHENRYINPKPHKEIPSTQLYFDNAIQLAKKLNIEKNQRADVILSGNFIMGDFIEALFYEKNIHAKKLIISTLSMSQNNIDSLVNLFTGGYIESLDLIISDYYFAHERNQLIPYMLKELDIKNTFQLAIAGSHTKIAMFETDGGKKIIISGSANLRSSGCLEQITIEENFKLFDFYKIHHNKIIKEYSIINKSIRRSKLWQVVAVDQAEVEAEAGHQPAQDVEAGFTQIRQFHSKKLEEKYF